MVTDDARIEEAVRAAVAAPYTRVFVREADGGYSTSVLELPGCYSSGDTAEHAMEMLDEAIALWVEAELEDGHEIPPPQPRQAIPSSNRASR